jgi:hypothetical protein
MREENKVQRKKTKGKKREEPICFAYSKSPSRSRKEQKRGEGENKKKNQSAMCVNDKTPAFQLRQFLRPAPTVCLSCLFVCHYPESVLIFFVFEITKKKQKAKRRKVQREAMSKKKGERITKKIKSLIHGHTIGLDQRIKIRLGSISTLVHGTLDLLAILIVNTHATLQDAAFLDGRAGDIALVAGGGCETQTGVSVGVGWCLGVWR